MNRTEPKLNLCFNEPELGFDEPNPNLTRSSVRFGSIGTLVEAILDKKLVRKKSYYLVKWKGYPLHDATWEPLENLKNTMEKVKEFELTRTSNFKKGGM